MLPTGVVPITASLAHPKSSGRRHPNWAPGFARPLTLVIEEDAREAREQNRQLNNQSLTLAFGESEGLCIKHHAVSVYVPRVGFAREQCQPNDSAR